MPIKERKRKNQHYQRSKTKSKFKLPKFVLFFLVGFIAFVFGVVFFSPNKFWDGKTRLALAIHNPDDSIAVAVFDPETNSISTLLIPQDVEVEVARQLGTWKAGSVWKLGINEKVGGKLVSETVTKALELPTEAWADTGAMGLTSENSFSIWRAALVSYKTNLNFKDKVKMAMFALGVKNSGAMRNQPINRSW